MPLFYDNPAFSLGGWAPELSKLIARRRFIPDWKPKQRIWRGTFQQWVQFEPNDWSGPFFWSGKPAIRTPRPASDKTVVAEENLYVGYYVERGLSSHAGSYREMDNKWHWHGSYRCLTEPVLRHELNALMMDLHEARRTLWLAGSYSEAPDGTTLPAFDRVLPYVGPSTLDDTQRIIDAIEPTQWINLMLGNRFSKEECLTQQGDLVAEFRNPLIRANEIRVLIQGAVAGVTSP